MPRPNKSKPERMGSEALEELIEICLRKQQRLFLHCDSYETAIKARAAALVFLAVKQTLQGFPQGLQEFAKDGFWESENTPGYVAFKRKRSGR